MTSAPTAQTPSLRPSSAGRQRRVPEPVPEQAPARNLRRSVRANRSTGPPPPVPQCEATNPAQPYVPSLTLIQSGSSPATASPTQKEPTKKPTGPKHKLQRTQLPEDLDIRGTEVRF